jgi:hypothetical protein
MGKQTQQQQQPTVTYFDFDWVFDRTVVWVFRIVIVRKQKQKHSRLFVLG